MIHSYNKSQRDALFLKFILLMNSACFGLIYCPSSAVLVLYSQKYLFVILACLLAMSVLTLLADSNITKR